MQGLYARSLAPLVTVRGFGMTPQLSSFLLPASGLQHVGFIQAAYGEALHRPLQVFAHFK